jgi:hypothetical protein
MARAWLVLAFLVLLSPVARAADADKAAEAAAAFQSLYGAELDRLRASRDPKESVGLATKLLAAAKQAPAQPEFVAVLCEKAYELALAHPDGYATAIDAVRLEAAAVPEKAAACADRLVEVRQRQFDLAKGDARPSAGEILIGAVLAAFEARKEAGAAADEIASYKRALMVARVIKSDRAGELETHVKALEQAIRLAVEIENLKKLIAADPKNQAARQRLVRLYLVDLDDPAEAAKLLEGVEDASLLKYVPAAAKPVETVPEFACLELGEWYRGLADAATPAAKALMFVRAKAYCERFLQLHVAEDLDRTKAALLLQKIAGEMQAAGTPKPVANKQGPSPSTKTRREEWIDLLPLVDLSKDALGGGWEKNGAELAIKSEVARTRVAIPVLVDGAYEFEVHCTRIFGQQTYGVVLPVGSRQALLRLSQVSRESDLCGLDGTKIPTPIRSGDETVVLARVTPTGDQAEIDVKLNGNPLIHWKGPVTSLPSPEWWAMPNAKCPGVVSSGVKSVWHSARLRMLSGEAKPLRPAAAK